MMLFEELGRILKSINWFIVGIFFLFTPLAYFGVKDCNTSFELKRISEQDIQEKYGDKFLYVSCTDSKEHYPHRMCVVQTTNEGFVKELCVKYTDGYSCDRFVNP